MNDGCKAYLSEMKKLNKETLKKRYYSYKIMLAVLIAVIILRAIYIFFGLLFNNYLNRADEKRDNHFVSFEIPSNDPPL